MIGIASLQSAQNPGQAPMAGMMPGQAPMPGQMPGQMPGMMPKPGAATPEAEISQYQGMSLPELIAQFQLRPSGPLLGLITKQTQEAELQKAQANQAAMAQAQQQQGTVKDMAIGKALQALQPTQMAAQGGIMQGYAGGGAVAFEDGGEAEDLSDDPSLPLMERWKRAQKRRELSRQQGIGRPFSERFQQVKAEEVPTDTGDEITRMLNRTPARQPLFSPEAIALMQRQGPRWTEPRQSSLPITNLGGGRASVSMSSAQRNPVQAQSLSGDMTPEERQVYESHRAMLEGRRNRPESLTRAEQGLADLARANIEAQQREAEEFRREAMERRDAGLARAQQSIWSNPQAMLALAGGIDTRRGQGVGSFARGLANIMGQQEKMADTARKEYAEAQTMQRTLDEAIRRTRELEARRQWELEKSNFENVSKLDDQIQNSRAEEERAKRAIRDKAIEQNFRGREVGVKEAELDINRQRLALAASEAARGTFDERVLNNYITLLNKNPVQADRYLQSVSDTRTALNPSVMQRAKASEEANATRREANEIARQKLLATNMGYQTASMRYNNATDPAKKAQAAAVMREIERRNGIVTEDEQTTPTAGNANDPLGIRK